MGGRVGAASTAADTFATFLDALAESLDEHRTRGDELAARAPRAHVRGAPVDAGARRLSSAGSRDLAPGDPMRWVANGA